MAVIEIYCDCKVKEIGTATITGDAVYIVWMMHVTDNNWAWPWRFCKHCGKRLRVVDCKCSYCLPAEHTLAPDRRAFAEKLQLLSSAGKA